MARPTNSNVSKITSIGLSKNGIKGALAGAVLATVATAATTNILDKFKSIGEARRQRQAAKTTETAPAE